MTELALGVLGDRELAARLGRAAEARAREFAVERIVPLYEQLYHDVLGA